MSCCGQSKERGPSVGSVSTSSTARNSPEHNPTIPPGNNVSTPSIIHNKKPPVNVQKSLTEQRKKSYVLFNVPAEKFRKDDERHVTALETGPLSARPSLGNLHMSRLQSIGGASESHFTHGLVFKRLSFADKLMQQQCNGTTDHSPDYQSDDDFLPTGQVREVRTAAGEVCGNFADF